MVYQRGVFKTSVFLAVSNAETASFTTVIEGDVCYILMATRSTPLTVGVILRRNITFPTIVNSTQFTGTIGNVPANNSISNSNSFLYSSDNTLLPTSTVSQSSFTVSVTTSSAHGLTSSSLTRLHVFYWCVTSSSNYYPGNYLYNSALRRNSVPLDVNVQLPTEISSNPLINETDIQDLSIDSLQVWQTQDTQTFTRATGGQPSTATQWDFSDGTYTAGTGNRTTRSPNFISFGALSAGGNNERVYLYRLREVLVCPNTNIPNTDLRVFTDLNPTTVNYYSSAGTTATSNIKYFGFQNTSRPALSSVVELCYVFNLLSTTFVNLDRNTPTITIGDGFVIPIYGYSAFSDIRSSVFPNLVLSVGNRVVLSGYDNRVVFSNSDWSYRGMSWNNFQVSSINFSSTSAYSIALGQQSSKVLGMASVNGVLIAATDTGIFRISGDNVSTPPNAVTANTSRLSNEVVASSDCLLVYESRVFFVSANGLFQLQYSMDTEELALSPISVQTSDYFKRVPICLNYSTTYRAFIISFSSGRELLVYSFESETFSVFKFSFTPVALRLSQTLDGYQVVFSQGGGNHTVYLCQWDNAVTTDLSNALDNLLTGSPAIRTDAIIPGSSLLVTASPTDVNSLCTPAELIETLDTAKAANLVVAYGENHARVSIGSDITLTEHSGGRQPAPILSFYVSKAFMSDKLLRNNRIRAVNLLISGTGEILTGLLFPNKDVSNVSQAFERTSVNLLSPGIVRANTNVATRTANGDLVNLRLRLVGVGEGWVLACQLTQDIVLLGYQFDTSTKKRGRLV
jgi:hypothetical protein